jgi:hypothetical protein
MEADHGSLQESWANHRLQSFQIHSKSPDQPNISLWITYKNGAAALDNGVELEEVAKKVIGSTEFQNKARVGRNEYRKVLGTEYVRELILK